MDIPVTSLITGACFAIGVGSIYLFPPLRDKKWPIILGVLLGLLINRTAGNEIRQYYKEYKLSNSLYNILTEGEEFRYLRTNKQEADIIVADIMRIYKERGQSAADAELKRTAQTMAHKKMSNITKASKEAWYGLAKSLTRLLAEMDSAGSGLNCLRWLRGDVTRSKDIKRGEK